MKSLIATAVLLISGSQLVAGSVKDLLKRPEAWFASPEAGRILENILSHQASSGGWPKNADTAEKRYQGDLKSLHGTFDNGATTDELRVLARFLQANPNDAAARDAFLKGFAHILEAQYENGGWPQSHPPGDKYPKHITFNDGAMVRLMEFLREVNVDPRYRFVPIERRQAAAKAFERGVDCILKCQIRIHGRPTVWCAQHDKVTLAPAAARAYELPSLSGFESVAITRLLMSLENPSPAMREAVEGALDWFRATKIEGIRVEPRKGPEGDDKVVVRDPDAGPLWARFYDLKTGKPFFCGRDGIPRATLAEIDRERRTGYAWYGNWPQSLLEEAFKR